MTVMLDAGGLLAYVRTVPIGYGKSSCNNDDDGTLSLSPYPSILAEFNFYMGSPRTQRHIPYVPGLEGLGWNNMDARVFTIIGWEQCLG